MIFYSAMNEEILTFRTLILDGGNHTSHAALIYVHRRIHVDNDKFVNWIIRKYKQGSVGLFQPDL